MGEIKSIYLAGKISRDDWRCEYIDFLSSEQDWENILCWPTTKNAIHSLDYTGPYLANLGGHGLTHGHNAHGVGIEYGYKHDQVPNRRAKVKDLCVRAIHKADLFFAWIDCKDCYGTIAEVGYAKGFGKPVWIAGPGRIDDLWFVYEMADKEDLGYEKPEDALETMLMDYRYETWTSDSPIERAFWKEWMDGWNNEGEFPLKPQYVVGKYRVDFAQVKFKTIIELDGHATHSSPSAIAYDRRRQRELESLGWKVIRFGGKEIHEDPQKCVAEVLKILSKQACEKK